VDVLARKGKPLVLAGRCARLEATSGNGMELPGTVGVTQAAFDLERPDELDAGSLHRVATVYHLAAQVHVMSPTVEQNLRFNTVNVVATESLARKAAKAGVKRFVYLSSIKVNGERTSSTPFRFDDAPNPSDAYGRSKWQAEEALGRVARESSMEVVIVRPPLVYGPGVRANFERLIRAANAELPLPIASVRNKRSLVSVWNLVSLLELVADHPRAPGKVWLVSDDDDVSTPELFRRMAKAMGKRSRLWAFPPSLLRMAGRLAGMGPEVDRLTESLRVDVTPAKEELGWVPPVTLDEGLSRTAKWVMEKSRVGL